MTSQKMGMLVGSLIAGFFALMANAQDAQFSLDDVSTMSVEERRTLFSEGTSMQLENPNDFLKLFSIGLADTDQVTKRRAAKKLALTVTALQQMKRSGEVIPVDLGDLEEIRAALRKTLNDVDPETRGAAIQSLAFSDAPNDRIERDLLARLSSDSNSQLKGAIIETMMFAGYESPAFKQAVLTSLRDPDDYVHEAAARAVPATMPEGALPIVAELYEKGILGRYGLEAIAAYGSQALQYVPILEKMAADPIQSQATRDAINAVIEAIKNPPPQAAATPQVKAVSLVDSSSKPPTPTTSAAQTTPVPPAATPDQQPKSAASPSSNVQAEPSKSSPWPMVIGAILLLAVAGGVLLKLRRK